MLVVANGAFKSGSTWLQGIVQQMAPFEAIPDAFRSPFHRQPWLYGPRIEAFLASGVHESRDFVTKGHVYRRRQRDALLGGGAAVRILDIHRDLRDVVVSHYYHFLRERSVEWTFGTYYWRVGRYKAFQVIEFHRAWKDPAPNVYVSSYERLKEDFADEVRRIGAFLGIDLDSAEVERIREATSLRSMQQRRGEQDLDESKRFFRKGAVGDWRNHFDESMLEDLSHVERFGLGWAGALGYRVMFDVRPRLVTGVRLGLRRLAPR